jgi:hypothetical protein
VLRIKSLFFLMRQTVFGIALIFAAAVRAEALSPEKLIGMTPYEALSLTGAPTEIYSLHDEEHKKDLVITFYENGLYFMWNDNRLWQVRADKRYKEKILGLAMHSTPAAAKRVFGQPLRERFDELIFRLPYDTFPIEVRLFYERGQLVDFYIYRADI